MRPDILNPLFSDASRIKGVGPAVRKALSRLLGTGERAPQLRDLLFHLPAGILDRRFSPTIAEAPDGAIVTLLVRVEEHAPPPARKHGGKTGPPYRVFCSDASGQLALIFFHARQDYLSGALPPGEMRVISGRFERNAHRWQMTHPDIIARPDEMDAVKRVEPVYPLTHSLSNRQLVRLMTEVQKLTPDLPEWIDPEYLKQQRWPTWQTAILSAHAPQDGKDMDRTAPARLRLAYDEVLANQLALALMRTRQRKRAGRIIPPGGQLLAKVTAALPYRLTAGQQMVLAEIDADLASGNRMLRLLQGDVGSGKTVVALLAMLRAVEAGMQAAIMVPTEILGRQHLAFIERVTAAAGVRAALLTGNVKGRDRDALLAAIASGQVDIVIGTHALFQEQVEFKSLALAVIDEQHRFGVAQRLALAAKGEAPHLLLMTATPIPRSLTMTAFGDLDCSRLTEKPSGRLAVQTNAIPLDRLDEVIEGVRRALAKGEKVYWICPLVEESEEDDGRADLAAAEDRFRLFGKLFGGRVGLAHGRMKAEERAAVMAGFAGDSYDLLVATTVVEVGVDVPSATIIIIEHAERFGLAQLHQLRGRVGRGGAQAHCILLYQPRIGEIARERLKTLRASEDGFFIAEEDLRLRGGGDILGTRQSGLPELRFADLFEHRDLIAVAHDDVKLILHRDAKLRSPRGEALRILLYLLGYDESIRFLDSG